LVFGLCFSFTKTKPLNIDYEYLFIMVRPRRWRHVYNKVEFNYYKPRGVPLSQLQEVKLDTEELEALRYTEIEEMEQKDAAEKMNISQPTYHRILKSARKKVANALINGKAIKIQGGKYKMPNKDGKGPEGKGPRTGRGLGKCTPAENEKLDETRPRRGMGRGQGRGFGRRRRT